MHALVATLLPKLAVTAELIVFDADLLFLPALGQHSVAAGCVPPLFLPGAVWSAGGSVIKELASCAPVLSADCLPSEALRIYSWVHPGQGLVGVTRCLLPEILVIHYQARPPVALTGLHYYGLIGH